MPEQLSNLVQAATGIGDVAGKGMAQLVRGHRNGEPGALRTRP